MVTKATLVKNLVFVLLAVVVLAFIGVRYADVGHLVGFRDSYTVRVQLARTGGLFEHANVTYRGVSVGRVGAVDLTAHGVEAALEIEESAPRIPSDLKAQVAGLSAVGEQYIDLQPRKAGGPYLGQGAVIERADTGVPAPPTKVLTSLDRLTSSVPLESLRTVVDELGTLFHNRGDDLDVLLDSGAEFIDAADANFPATQRLLVDGQTVLRTQNEEGEALRAFARGAEELAGRMKSSDTDLRRLIAETPGAATQLSGLLEDVDPSLGVLLANLTTTSELAVTRQHGIEELLVRLPQAAAVGSTAITGRGAEFGMAVTFFDPLPCTDGYGGTRYRNGLDTSSGPTNTEARCASSPSTGKNVRGSANVPTGGPLPSPAKPGSLRLGKDAGGKGALPGALGLPGTESPQPHGMRDLLDIGGGR
ncbi:MCE family protein [Streptomyces sulphureus]|uniref:MCE family protein n=1 Tax=Streptomyces sulphureus TaxID=47758 RepID=UPI00037998E4|nr:MlaD family protein [Streptomyces sulphureus]